MMSLRGRVLVARYQLWQEEKEHSPLILHQIDGTPCKFDDTLGCEVLRREILVKFRG